MQNSLQLAYFRYFLWWTNGFSPISIPNVRNWNIKPEFPRHLMNRLQKKHGRMGWFNGRPSSPQIVSSSTTQLRTSFVSSSFQVFTACLLCLVSRFVASIIGAKVLHRRKQRLYLLLATDSSNKRNLEMDSVFVNVAIDTTTTGWNLDMNFPYIYNTRQ